MAESIISKYARRDGQKDAARPEAPAAGRKPYLAHEGKDRQIYLRLHPYKRKSSGSEYRHLFYYEYDDEIFETLVLEFGFIEVLVTGKNLEPIVTAIDNHTCRYIREFHPDVHEHPGEGQPIVTQLSVRDVALPKPLPAGDPDEEK